MTRLVIVLAVVVMACGSSGSPTVASVEDLGKLPLPAKAVGRDGGLGGSLGGRLMWTFGDTFLSEPNHLDNSTVLSATSGWSTVADPLALAQSLSIDGDQPAQLVPYTPDELATNTTDSLNGVALWPGALIDIGGGIGIVPFEHVERMSGSGFQTDAIGTARVIVDAAIATRTPGFVFAAPEPLFEPELALDGFVYAFACDNVGFLDFRCKLARVAPAAVEQRAAYEFYDGSQWTAAIGSAAYIIDRTAGGPSLSFNEHLGKYLAVNCEIVSSTVLLRVADHIEGPWSDGVEIDAGDGILAPSHDSDYDYICVEHPELADHDSIVISYSRPTEPFQGDVRLARITFD
jgi:hypothetical protein